MTDPSDRDDLIVVQQVLAVAPHELEASWSRARALLDARLASPARRTARRWVPAITAAVVLVVALGVAGYLRRPAPEPAGAPPVVDVAAAFDRLATAASETLPVTIGADQVLFVRSDGVMSDFEHDPPIKTHYRYDLWADPQGMRPLRVRRYEQRLDVPVLDLREHQLPPRPGRPGSDFAVATPAMIAALPTDPAAMWTALTNGTAVSRGDWSVEQGVWDGMREFLPTADSLLPPAVRTALYRALAGIPGLTATRIEIGSRAVVSFRRVERKSLTELLFDEQSGRYLGEGSGALGLPLVTAAPSPVPNIPLERTITTRIVVTCTVVDRDQIPS
ncbi:MAG TPA: hypothetical protein VL738_30600 [Dactylosporangium sp.]|jgi:hypothetical protein|nr:hypothetical protein [Dactylosporangium sp.]